jgi:Cortical protein marker for cell polarity
MRNLFSLLSSTELATAILAASSYIIPGVYGINFQPVAPSNLDLTQLGRVAIAGDFDSISLYQFQGQSQNGVSANGSHSILSRFPTGAFASLQSSDGYIQAMCPFVLKNGTLEGVIVGGNFTSLGGVEAQGVALFKPDTAEIVPLPGVNGRVQALYCDQNSSTVYVGGTFSAANSSNAITWTTTWTNMPFAGFNGPVTSITKASNGNIVFGGEFDGLGNTTTPKNPDGQVIPITSANISAGTSTIQNGFSDPRNIICKTNQGGSGNTWLLADNTPGAWTATFQFGFVPTKLRLFNTNQDGRGTKTFRYTAIPINGIMNFTYTDPSTGQQKFCDSQCPLPQNNNTAQDFHFVNNVGMDGFRLDISEWYGSGGGLDGIELFEDDIYSFAINDFNEPTCSGSANGGTATTTGPWAITPSRISTSEYLTAQLSGSPVDPKSASVVFQPDIQQSGNYSVTIFTPGCYPDGTCSTRGRVNITGQMGSGSSSASSPVSTEIFQTNSFDKYDQIYFGYVDASSSSFRPSITLAPSANQNGPLTVVAQRVRFQLQSSTGGLNGLFEYNPNQATVSTDFSSSAIDTAGKSLNQGAEINALAVQGGNLFVAGNFSANGINNVFYVGSGNATSLPEGGLNGAVNAMYENGTTLYIGGTFTGTHDNKTHGLNNLAAFDTDKSTWSPLGAGVNGLVTFIVPFQVNLTTGNHPELALAISGTFNQVNAFSSNSSFAVTNFAVWVPGRGNWLQNLGLPSISLQGILTAASDVPGFSPLFGGNIASQASSASGAIELTSGTLNLQQFPVKIQNPVAPTASKRKRSLVTANTTGVVTGLMYNQNNLNLTVLGGHFTATASNGSTIQNLLLINGSNSDSVTGLTAGVSSDSVFATLGASGTLLFAGGQVSGNVNGNNVNGLVVYDLMASNYAATQPPALTGSSVVVNAIAPRPSPSSSSVFVGGSFSGAGSFNCPSLCVFDTSRLQWNSPGNGLTGTVTSLTWINDQHLIIGGNLTVSGNTTSLATYDPKTNSFSSVTNANGPTGTVTAVTPGSSDGSQIWVGGQNADGSAYLTKYNGSAWSPVNNLFGSGTTIRGLQVFSLTNSHASSSSMANNNDLMILGQLNIPNFGNASAALYNGTTITPFLLSNNAQGGGGSLSQAFVQNPQNFFKSSGEPHDIF